MTAHRFIGCSQWGFPMAKNLAKKGFTVTAFDSNPEAVRRAGRA